MSSVTAPSVTMNALLEAREPLLPARLQCGERTCDVLSLLRFFPGRRAVFAARLEGREVILKLYANQAKARRELQDEASVLRGLKAKGLAAPAIVASLEDGEERALVLEHLGQKSAKAVLATLAEPEVADLVNALVAFTGQMHAAGAMQDDIHLENFVLHDGRWHVIDAGGVTLAARFSRKARLNNLALLLAQFPPLSLPAAEQIVASYQQDITVAELVSTLRRVREKRLKSLVKKSLRDCSEFVSIDQGGLSGMARRADQPLVETLLSTGLDQLLEESELLKDGNSATVGRVTVQGETLVIKRYNVKSCKHRIKRQVGKSRARKSWLAGCFLLEIGVKTPEPIAFFEEKRGGVKGRAWIIHHSVQGRGLDAWPSDLPLNDALLNDLKMTFSLMRLLGFSHGDMKASNWIVSGKGLILIDLDSFSMFESERKRTRRIKKDVERLLRNWAQGDAVREQLKLELSDGMR